MIWNAAVYTPWWVYVLLIYLVSIGCLAKKSQIQHVTKMAIVPLIFLALSVQMLTSAVNLTLINVSIWAMFKSLGFYFGWLVASLMAIRVDVKHFLVEVPGNWHTLITILLIFSTKFYFGAVLADDPNHLQDTVFEISMISVAGLLSGFFLGKFACFIYRLYRQSSINLEKVE